MLYFHNVITSYILDVEESTITSENLKRETRNGRSTMVMQTVSLGKLEDKNVASVSKLMSHVMKSCQRISLLLDLPKSQRQKKLYSHFQ